MELRHYWNVIWRRRWLVLAIVAAAALFSAFSFFTTPRTYESAAVFTVRYPDSPGANDTPTNGSPASLVFNYAGYYYYLSSEYQVDDFTQIIETDAFGDAVLKVMQEQFSQGRLPVSDTVKFRSDLENLRPRDVVDMVGADRRHRELNIFTVAPTRDLSKSITDAAGTVLTGARLEPVRGTFDDWPVFAQMDMVTYDTLESSTSKELTNAVIRVVLGLVVALAIAFLLEYLDNSIRDERDAGKVLDLPVIGAIPRS